VFDRLDHVATPIAKTRVMVADFRTPPLELPRRLTAGFGVSATFAVSIRDGSAIAVGIASGGSIAVGRNRRLTLTTRRIFVLCHQKSW
jgi:hypothetical protein